MGALMRSQNPPQAYLDRALAVEKCLRPATIASIYVIGSVSWAILISLIFAASVYLSSVTTTPLAITIFLALALIPAGFAVAAWCMRPNDLLSTYLSRYANMCRTPITATNDQRMFKVMLMTGEAIAIDLSFHYPVKEQKRELKERLYTLTHAALSSTCSMRNSALDQHEVEEAIDPAIEIVAREFALPILYAEVHEIGRYKEAYTIGQDDDSMPSPSLTAGTNG